MAEGTFLKDHPGLNSLVSIFYNFDRDAALGDMEQAQANLQAQLNDFAENYPDLKSVMQKEGLMNPDGSINPEKFVDSKLLEAVKQRAQESETKQVGALLKNARANQAMKGGGSNIQTAGLAGLTNETSRGLNREYGNAVNAERKNATNMAVNFGGKYQNDAIGKQNAKVQALQSDLLNKQSELNAQTAGLLQDPAAMMGLIQTGIGLATGNPAGVINGTGKLVSNRGNSGQAQRQPEPQGQDSFEDTPSIQPPDYYLHNSATKESKTKYGRPIKTQNYSDNKMDKGS